MNQVNDHMYQKIRYFLFALAIMLLTLPQGACSRNACPAYDSMSKEMQQANKDKEKNVKPGKQKPPKQKKKKKGKSRPLFEKKIRKHNR